MTRDRDEEPTNDRKRSPLPGSEPWPAEKHGEPSAGWDTEAHATWLEKWAPACPDGNPQRLGRPLGFRERNVGELELRVALGGDDCGVCQVIVDERENEVHVRVLVCYHEDDAATPRARDYMDCPVRVWLERPLEQRAVIDVDSDAELALFVPRYLDSVPQPDHGYRPCHRRRASA